jgi:hypothetical protein
VWKDCGNVTNLDGTITNEPIVVLFQTHPDVLQRVAELKALGYNLVGTVIGSFDAVIEFTTAGMSESELSAQNFPVVRIKAVEMTELYQHCLNASAYDSTTALQGSDVNAVAYFDQVGGRTELIDFVFSPGIFTVYLLMCLSSCAVAGTRSHVPNHLRSSARLPSLY